ncbi:hypothetical protein XANCAGTX0491_002916 [Xanthoria calcicola]
MFIMTGMPLFSHMALVWRRVGRSSSNAIGGWGGCLLRLADPTKSTTAVPGLFYPRLCGRRTSPSADLLSAKGTRKKGVISQTRIGLQCPPKAAATGMANRIAGGPKSDCANRVPAMNSLASRPLTPGFITETSDAPSST